MRVEDGLSFWKAAEEVKATTIFTTHTSVLAGHDVFPFFMMENLFSSYITSLDIDIKSFLDLGKDPMNPEAGFNMTAFALRMSGYINAVSKKHNDVTQKMWHHLWDEQNNEIEYITNGIHIPTWINPHMAALFDRYLGPNWLEHHDNTSIWELIDDIPEIELWTTHRLLKMHLIKIMQERARKRWLEEMADPSIVLASGIMFDPNSLTIGFARRFASYKRATLVLYDLDRLRKILNHPRRPVQIVFAGKAHPSDDLGKQLIQEIFNAAKDPSFGCRLAFVEDYDEDLAQYLVQGVDLWLNNPLPPFEASGTSGMKASINGVPHFSRLDGWWSEGYNGLNGWAFDSVQESNSDLIDSKIIYDILENEIVPLYYEKDGSGIPRNWVKVMKESIKNTAPRFNSRRMVK
ncbi:MAG: alpha-glucan family phosphorylase [Methanotrichaceae archaeon]|nr:alpha-glucan family phosphorylase [Methanotrichaceae archaeon]